MTGSIFDPTFIHRLEHAMFLKYLSRMMAVPVMPDNEIFEYLPTQAIADYLSTENNPPLDGIIFPSVQITDDALNVVLFHKASDVEELKMVEGTKVSADLGQLYEDGWEQEYTVYEKYPPIVKEQKKQRILPFVADWESPKIQHGYRTPTLKIDLDTICVHIVEFVKFGTSEHKVTRHKWEMSENKF
jgi:hypothetical protein